MSVNHYGRCGGYSGTSYSAAIASGLLALVLSEIKHSVPLPWNLFSSIYSLLSMSSTPLPHVPLLEQGHGMLDSSLLRSHMNEVGPSLTLFPSSIDLTDSSFFPYSLQPLYVQPFIPEL